MQHDKQLEEYGIFATNAKLEIKDNKITIINDENTKRAEIENIDCQKLQEKGVQKIDFRGCTFIKQLSLSESELCDTNIKSLTFYDCYFTESVDLQNINIETSFRLCDFDQEAIFYGSNFNNQKTITFAHITFNKKADFTGATFNQNTEFLDITFKEEANFYMTEFNCDKVTFNITCNKEANFKESFFENSAIFGNCDFKEDLNISIKESKKNEDLNSSIKKDQKIDFEKNKFNTIIIQKEFFSKNVNFKECIFLEKLVLKDYDFNEITFNTCIFQDNVYFNNSIFEDYADFHECEFEKTANFYGAKFEKAPNFSQVQFKGSLNAVNMDLDFGFESLREKIKAEYELSKQQAAPRAGKVLELQFHKSLASIANDFRDSFRIFKNALIKENNNLDASEFHKLELYCKEIELGESPNKRGIQAQSEEDVRKNTKPFKESIDWFLLRFYRKLSEHHTDLLRVLNNLVLLIALYAGFVYIGNFKIGDAKTSSISQQLFQHIEAFQNYIKNLSVVQEYSLVLIILLILFVAFAIYLVFKLKLLIHIKTTFKIILAGIMKNFWLLLKILSVILSIFCIITFIVLQFETNNRSSILVNIFGFCLFIILYLWLVCLDSIFLRYIVVIIAYIVASVALGDNIAILNPLLGKLISNKEPINDPLFTAITLAYTILTLLVLFSLQKTARKNSIVPS